MLVKEQWERGGREVGGKYALLIKSKDDGRKMMQERNAWSQANCSIGDRSLDQITTILRFGQYSKPAQLPTPATSGADVVWTTS